MVERDILGDLMPFLKKYAKTKRQEEIIDWAGWFFKLLVFVWLALAVKDVWLTGYTFMDNMCVISVLDLANNSATANFSGNLSNIPINFSLS